MHAGKLQDTQIFDPARLNPTQQAEFCGTCHYLQEARSGVRKGVQTVLSPSYRLMQSRCWSADDRRSECTFCHDPHHPTPRQTTFYDSKCLSCHVSAGVATSAGQTGKACPVEKQDCAGCHMPAVSVPGARASYSDHRIRIVHAGAPYPE